ncbi:alpha-(1,3)-fucosyltransferase 11-like [Ptychodera flava]|uniref:alpha-(1,3)-fucosyltransferase 11-like n=1 Tax=Ptychodera flava TaxID=63121 RepID=UPI003969FB23
MADYVYVLLLFAVQVLANSDDSFLPKVKTVFSSGNSSVPIVLWWTGSLFPHFQGDSATINCGRGSCLATKDKGKLQNPMTRGIIFYGTDFRADESPLPRQPHHEWALLHEESPMNNYILSHNPTMRMFNHTATFRRESDFPLTSLPIQSLDHLTARKPVPLTEKNRLRDSEGLASVLYVQSHCNVASDRDRYVKELMKYIKIDSYGECLNNKKLPNEELEDTLTMHHPDFLTFISRYKFHLAFENAICDDYMTEKLFRPLHVGSVPIYWGSSKARDWMPNDQSIIMMEDFESPQKLAEFITAVDQDDEEYLKYLKFKEEGVTNQFLIDHMMNRMWHDDEVGNGDFITSFECYVCDKVNERMEAESRHNEDPTFPSPVPHFGSYNHMGCPAPDVSYGDRSDVSVTEDFYMWPEDFWQSFEQAMALQQMIKVGEKDASKLFDYMREMRKKKRH